MRKFELLTPTAIEPKRATFASAGYDLFADENVVLEPHIPKIVKTGVTVRCPEDETLLIFIRSSLAAKRGIMLANGVGVVDADFAPNEIGVILVNITNRTTAIAKGDKIAQGLFSKYEKTDDDDTPVQKERTGGFGSSGER